MVSTRSQHDRFQLSPATSAPNVGVGVGLIKCDKGTDLMLLTDGDGTPLWAFTIVAHVAEEHSIETLVDERFTEHMPLRLLYDKAADADCLRDAPEGRYVELITPPHKNHTRPPRDEVEHRISWLISLRRLLKR